MFTEDTSVRKIITTTIIVAGLVIFLSTMSGIILYRRIKEHMTLKRGKMSIAPHRGENSIIRIHSNNASVLNVLEG